MVKLLPWRAKLMSIRLMMSIGQQWETSKMQSGYGSKRIHGPATSSLRKDQIISLTVPWANTMLIIWYQFIIITMGETSGLSLILIELFPRLTRQRWSGVWKEVNLCWNNMEIKTNWFSKTCYPRTTMKERWRWRFSRILEKAFALRR